MLTKENQFKDQKYWFQIER